MWAELSFAITGAYQDGLMQTLIEVRTLPLAGHSPPFLLPDSASSSPIRWDTEPVLRTQEMGKSHPDHRLLLAAIASPPWRLKRQWAPSYLESSNCHQAIFTALSHIGIFFRYSHSWNERCQSQQHVQGDLKRGTGVHDFTYVIKNVDLLWTLQGLGSQSMN